MWNIKGVANALEECYRLLFLRFMPQGKQVSKVMIHLPSLILQRMSSLALRTSMTITLMCLRWLKCSATGFSGFFLLVIYDLYPFIRQLSSCSVSLTIL